MGWLDQGLKNIFKGGKEFLSSPAGIMALGVLAPYASPWMAKFGATGLGKTALGKGASSLLGSPMISNALKNAAMNYGIATLTGSKHPGKAALWAGAASLPFTYLQGAQAAGAYNKAAKLAGSDQTANWWDYARGTDMAPIETITGGDITGWKDISPKSTTMIEDIGGRADMNPGDLSSIDWDALDAGTSMKRIDVPQAGRVGNIYSDVVKTQETLPEIGGYFTRDVTPKTLETLAGNPGIAGMGPMLGLENIDVMASLIPQVAGLYGGRMSDEERWLAAQEKQIRMWAFQFGIPYEEAKEIWAEGWRNPYYQTKTPQDYGKFANRGGYIDDYTAGGKAVGPGTGKSDSIQPVALSNGEFVFTEKATNNFPGGAEGLYSLMNRLDPESETPQEARA